MSKKKKKKNNLKKLNKQRNSRNFKDYLTFQNIQSAIGKLVWQHRDLPNDGTKFDKILADLNSYRGKLSQATRLNSLLWAIDKFHRNSVLSKYKLEEIEIREEYNRLMSKND